MRPIKLTISAFGPYAGCQVIDFEKLGKKGIYLITGDTGAGKTTILMPLFLHFMGRQAEKTGKPQCLEVSTQKKIRKLLWKWNLSTETGYIR